MDKNKWIEKVRRIQKAYGISEGRKQDGVSTRRITIIIGELYLSKFGRGTPRELLNVMILIQAFLRIGWVMTFWLHLS